jgi:hypothetical protein
MGWVSHSGWVGEGASREHQNERANEVGEWGWEMLSSPFTHLLSHLLHLLPLLPLLLLLLPLLLGLPLLLLLLLLQEGRP